jgi:hypothetical protein
MALTVQTNPAALANFDTDAQKSDFKGVEKDEAHILMQGDNVQILGTKDADNTIKVTIGKPDDSKPAKYSVTVEINGEKIDKPLALTAEQLRKMVIAGGNKSDNITLAVDKDVQLPDGITPTVYGGDGEDTFSIEASDEQGKKLSGTQFFGGLGADTLKAPNVTVNWKDYKLVDSTNNKEFKVAGATTEGVNGASSKVTLRGRFFSINMTGDGNKMEIKQKTENGHPYYSIRINGGDPIDVSAAELAKMQIKAADDKQRMLLDPDSFKLLDQFYTDLKDPNIKMPTTIKQDTAKPTGNELSGGPDSHTNTDIIV